MKKILYAVVYVLIMQVSWAAVTFAQANKDIRLLPPQLDGGKSLMQSLQDRKSSREFSRKELPLQVLSDLLWSANGVNRPETGYRTAPSAMNRQEIDVYVAQAGGLYVYDAKAHALRLVATDDIRSVTGQQPFVKEAPVNLIFVADYAKMKGMDQDLYAATDTGYVSENVYLYCASAGLATVVRGWFDKAALSEAMNLRPDQKIILTQTVGYPKE